MARIVRTGSAELAPRVVPEAGPVPTWSGKAATALTRAEVQGIIQFCTDTALALGIDDYLEGRPPIRNPFHPRFLNGSPHAAFATFYSRGQGRALSLWTEEGGSGPIVPALA